MNSLLPGYKVFQPIKTFMAHQRVVIFKRHVTQTATASRFKTKAKLLYQLIPKAYLALFSKRFNRYG